MRRVLLPLFLLGVGALALLAARAIEGDDSPPSPVGATSAVTPVLSPRRVPRVLLRPTGDERLRLALQPLLEQSPPSTCLVVEEGGREILGEQPDLGLVPASNQKTVVAHVILSALGPDTRYRTVVAAAGTPTNGVLEGDLWLIGGGDPLLTTDDFLGGFEGEQVHTDFAMLADRVADSGITTVTGAVIGDDSHYDDELEVEGWEPREHGPHSVPGPLDALLVNRGFTDYATDPETVIMPTPSSDPSGLAAQTLTDLLAERGVEVQGGSRSDVAPDGLAEVAAIESPPMHEVVAQMMTESDNTVAELLVKELGARLRGEGSTAAGLEVMRDTLEEQHLPLGGVVLADGSGLHGGNRLTCSLLGALLEREGPTSYLAASMPVAAESGTLRERFEETLVAGRLRAKTGQLAESTALGGYTSTVPGFEITFSYLANADQISEEETMRLQDLLATILVQYPEAPPLADVDPVAVGESSDS